MAMQVSRVGQVGRRRLAVVVTAVLLLVACTADPPAAPEPSASGVSLRVTTVGGAGELDDEARADMESAVGDVLSAYVVRGFLGDHPREDFVQAFAAFTSGAAESATGHINQLTAARFDDASAVRATRLEAELSYLVLGGRLIGATAAVDFRFAATVADEERPLRLRGRLMLQQVGGAWSVYGYDLIVNDAATRRTEVSS